MSGILMVPIHLDALYLKRETTVIEAMADFSRLPYNDGTRDVNSEIANISEEIVSKPFQSDNLRLKPGAHLHWALPDALTRGIQTANGTDFPAAPNRWLITRRVERNGRLVADGRWIVESDYLYPEGVGGEAGAVNIPYEPNAAKGERQPFRYLGRNLPLSAWREGAATAQYLKGLSAVGYGEPSFAAFYPNCHSVFGFYDDAYADKPPDGVQYELIGWYSDSEQDYLNRFRAAVIADYQAGGKTAPTVDDLRRELAARAGWRIKTDAEFPNQTLCYARLTFQPGAATAGAERVNSALDIAVGNTGAEALSAYLASAIVRERRTGSLTEADYRLKAQIEDQLEAVSLSERLEQRQLDVGPKFQEARHEKGFTAVPGGFIWTVSPEAQDVQADAVNSGAQKEITLPDEMAHSLNMLNLRQQEYDRALDEIESMRRQLFCDWYKYMLCAYPPEDARDDYPNIDEVRHYLEVKGVAPLQDKIRKTGRIQIDITGDQVVAATTDSSTDSAAAKLKEAITDLQQAVTAYNSSPAAQKAGMAYRLKQIPAPRYWQPNEPVALIIGPAAEPTLRHGKDGRLNDGLLDCHYLSGDLRTLIPSDVETVSRNIDRLSPDRDQEKIGFSVWTRQPWNPFLLEWEVEFFPTESDGNLDPMSGDYGHGFVTENYTLAENDVDLSIKSGRGAVTRAANVYRGSTILTPNAAELSRAEMEDYLQRRLLDDYCEDLKLSQPEQPGEFFRKNIAAILNWYRTESRRATSLSLSNIVRAYELLTAPNFHCLAQSLGGFNDALLMRKQTLQLIIADPLGFSDYQAFAARVRDCVKDSIRSAPEPLNDFNPIRAGALRIIRLRLIDTFGRFIDLDCDNVVTTEKMTLPANQYLMALPPRLAQPARLNFRWLSASADEQEMNDHPATTPICGWVLANNLDNSLMIYDEKGKSLGYIDRLARWRPAPGDDSAVDAGAIGNPHLRKMVAYILAQGAEFLNDFITAIDNALENIEPENYAQSQDLALLMGRPLALARASLNLELQGLPAIHQGWEMFRQDMRRPHRETNRFDRVRFPIRIGEYRQFNDGLVGYWKETGDGYEDNLFYAPQTDALSHGAIRTHADSPMTIYQTVYSTPQILAMLIDPRGKAHATAGVTPCKAIDIPPDQYAEALRNIEITFLSAPILTDAGRINLPLPEEPGFSWSWLQRENGSWSEVSSAGTVTKQAFLIAFTDGEAVWARLKEKGWIKEIDPVKAGVTPKDSRAAPDLGEDMKDKVAEIEIILARSYIGKVGARAAFAAPQEIREGWLKLRKAEGKTNADDQTEFNARRA